MPTLEHELRAAVNVSVDGHQEMAGFEVSINGRFWVSTEAQSTRPPRFPVRFITVFNAQSIATGCRPLPGYL